MPFKKREGQMYMTLPLTHRKDKLNEKRKLGLQKAL